MPSYPIAEKGDFVVKVIVGGGCKTATVQQVESVKNDKIRLVDGGCMEYNLYTGREIDPAIPGFYSELIAFDGDEVEQWGFAEKVEK